MSGRAEAPLPPLMIDVARRKGAVVVSLTGAATMEHVEKLRATLLTLAEDPVRRIVLDMSGLDFISSVGLGAIVAAYLRCSRRQIALRLAAPQAKVRDMLGVTKLTQLLTICDSVDEAMTA